MPKLPTGTPAVVVGTGVNIAIGAVLVTASTADFPKLNVGFGAGAACTVVAAACAPNPVSVACTFPNVNVAFAGSVFAVGSAVAVISFVSVETAGLLKANAGDTANAVVAVAVDIEFINVIAVDGAVVTGAVVTGAVVICLFVAAGRVKPRRAPFPVDESSFNFFVASFNGSTDVLLQLVVGAVIVDIAVVDVDVVCSIVVSVVVVAVTL